MYVLTDVAAARHLGRRSLRQVVVPAGGVLITTVIPGFAAKVDDGLEHPADVR
jgi:hypothetical protein